MSIRFFKDLAIKIEEDYTKYLNLQKSKWIKEDDKDEFYNKLSNAESISDMMYILCYINDKFKTIYVPEDEEDIEEENIITIED